MDKDPIQPIDFGKNEVLNALEELKKSGDFEKGQDLLETIKEKDVDEAKLEY